MNVDVCVPPIVGSSFLCSFIYETTNKKNRLMLLNLLDYIALMLFSFFFFCYGWRFQLPG